MDIRKYITHSNIYFFGLIFLGASLPLSIYTTSMAEILLLANWILEGNFRRKFNKFVSNKGLWLITSLYLLHLVGLIHTSDFDYALHDLKIKLPILILPLIIGTSEKSSPLRIKIILMFFVMAVVVSTLISFGIFLHIIPYEYYDIREISIFISHIRLALMVNLSAFILVYYCLISPKELRISNSLCIFVVLPVFLWLAFFLVILKSFTGIIVFLCVSFILGLILSGKIDNVIPRFLLRVFLITMPLLIASYIAMSIDRFYDREEVDFSELEEYTSRGNRYYHDTTKKAIENGNYVWLYINEKELRKEWNKISELPYKGKDNKKQLIKYTLIRYLTSKGLRKDAEGVKKLTEEDIRAIENGLANHIFLERYSIYPRVYEIIWEIDGYIKGKDPSGHSVAQRIVYLNAAKEIISKNFIIGVGTGDVQRSFNEYYANSDTKLRKNVRLRAHNQYVTFLITFGVIGFIIAMVALVGPVFILHKWRDYLFILFFLIALLSMLNEDTLETQTGVSFFMYFYSLLLFGREK